MRLFFHRGASASRTLRPFQVSNISRFGDCLKFLHEVEKDRLQDKHKKVELNYSRECKREHEFHQRQKAKPFLFFNSVDYNGGGDEIFNGLIETWAER